MKGSVKAVEAEGLSQSQPSIYKKKSRLTRWFFVLAIWVERMKGSVEAVEAEELSQSQPSIYKKKSSLAKWAELECVCPSHFG